MILKFCRHLIFKTIIAVLNVIHLCITALKPKQYNSVKVADMVANVPDYITSADMLDMTVVLLEHE